MDGSFACPECGSDVEMRGLAPGRQVRCEFCHRLLEVPFLPRAASRTWQRRRFNRPKWVPWAWAGLGLLLVAVLGAGAVKFLKRHYDTVQDRSINRLLESSRVHEAAGRIGEALVDLDAALDLAQKAGADWSKRVDRHRGRRPDLARRDALGVLSALSGDQSTPFRLGEWLNLIARVSRDPDLAAMGTTVDEGFQYALINQIGRELAAARQLLKAGDMSASMNACDRSGALLAHVPKTAEPAFRRDIEAVASELIRAAGITVVVSPGRFVYGSKSYVSELLPLLDGALVAGGYLPKRESSPWRDLWPNSRFSMRLDVDETQDGQYLSSPNRLTLIHAELTLTSGDEVIWRSTPQVRSAVPLPKLPAYLSRKIAVGSERSDEFERMLYKNARDQIDQKFQLALSSLPPWASVTGRDKR
jgi:hypothetical protein